MPINIPCEYECDQCHTKVDGLSGKLPDGWMRRFDPKTFMTPDVGEVLGYFHSKECHDAFVVAEPQSVSVEALTVPLG